MTTARTLRSWICPSCAARMQITRSATTRLSRALRPRSLQTSAAPSPSPPTSTPAVPLRKQLKDIAKQKKLVSKQQKRSDPSHEAWELTVGIEVHARLNTRHKLFSSATTSSRSRTADADSETANSADSVAAFDLALPGSQPIFQAAALVPAIRAALAFDCQVQRRSSWDRKHYFHWDQPAGYQITQYYEPFARDGSLTLLPRDGVPEPTRIGIKQIQLEQDTAKTTLPGPGSSQYMIDYSRAGSPLIEIITLPQIHSPSAAAAVVRKIRDALKAVGACDGNMDRADLRADVNVSVRRRGSDSAGVEYGGVTGLGTRTEIKNLNSFRAVEDAVTAERDRQIKVLEAGGTIIGETRGWTVGGTETRRLRSKEGEVDYRYMPDPDLGLLWIKGEMVSQLRDALPEGPDELLDRMVREWGVSEKDAATLVSLDDGERIEFIFETIDLVHKEVALQREKVGRTVSNWTLHEIGGLLTTSDQDWSELKITPADLAAILVHLLHKQITGRSAKQLLQTIADGARGKSVSELIEDGNLLLQPMSEAEYIQLAQSIVQDNPDIVQAIKIKNQTGKIMFLVGQMMRQAAGGTVEAEKAREVIDRLLQE